MKATELLKQHRDQYLRELRNLEAQANGVKRAMDVMQAKIEAVDYALSDITVRCGITETTRPITPGI